MDIAMDQVQNSNKKSEDDKVQELMGGIGKYHIILLLFMIPCKIPTALHPLGIVFLAPPVRYNCTDNGINYTNINHCPCENPEYDTSVFTETIITNWDLICDRKFYVSFSQTIHMLGLLIGSFIFGALSDRFGRKPTLLISSGLEIVAGIAASFSPNFWLFAIFRLLTGCAVGGILIISFVLVMEFTGKKYRELLSCLLQIPFNMGYALLPLIGYFIRSWTWINFAYSIPAAGFIFIYWVLPETPRWLLISGKTEEAIKIVEKVAKINNRPTLSITKTITEHQSEKSIKNTEQKVTMFNLFTVPSIRKNMICIIVNWTVCSFGFFGVSQYIGQLSGDIFVNVTIGAALNILGTLVAYLSMKWLPRKISMIVLNLGTSLCLFIIAVIPEHLAILKVISACIGNLCSFAAFVVIYLYTTELFPTVVRNAAMGIASMFSRIGAMIAPFVVTLGSWVAPVAFGIAPLIAALLCIPLPETKNRELPDTMREANQIVLNRK